MEDDEIYQFALNWFELAMRQGLANMTAEETLSSLGLHHFIDIVEHNLGEALAAASAVDQPGDG